MSDFLIDAPLMACPDPRHGSAADFQSLFIEFLSRLADLSRLRSACESIKFWRDEDLSNVLCEHQCYPFRHILVRAFERLHNPMEFQLEDVNTLATALLERSLRIEESGTIRDVAVSSCSLANDPVSNRGAPFLDHFCRFLALALPVLGDGKEFWPNTYVASCGLKSTSTHVTANFTIDVVEFDDGSYGEGSRVEGLRIANYRGASVLFREIDLVAWWASASKGGLIDICAVSAAVNDADPWPTLARVRDNLSLGSEFVSSARSLGFMHEAAKISRLLRVCSDLVHVRNLANCHWLRTGRGANDPQRIRGAWRAWRHDIDDEFHLHFWRSGNRIKLANVVVHNDFGIAF